MATVFAAGHFEQLHRILTDAIASPARVAHSNEWYIALDRSRADLVDIGRVKAPDDAERREVQSGQVTIEGVAHKLNEDFAQQALALAKHLHVSERYAASLLQAGMQARAKWGRSAVEVACILFHRERLAVLACLKELIGGAATLVRDEDADARRLGAKMQQIVDAILAVGGQSTTAAASFQSFAHRVLREIDGVKEKMTQIEQDVRGIGRPSQQQGGPAPLGDELQLQRMRMLRKERQDLGHVLYLLSCSYSLGAKGVQAITDWLAAVKASEQEDAMVVYLLIVLLNALEVSPSDDDDTLSSGEASSANPLLEDSAFIKQMHTSLMSKPWQLKEARNVVLLQACLFLAEATRRSPSLANEIRVHGDTLQKYFHEAVEGGAFYFIVLRVLAFRQRQVDALEGEETDTTEVVASRTGGNAKSLDGDEEEIDVDFQEYVLAQVQDLLLSLTSTMLPLLRKLQRAEEDADFAAARQTGNVDPPLRRYDIEALFDSISLLCRARPDAGLPFWLGAKGKGTRFLNWAVEVREPGHQRALFEMLASLSAGKESAWHAHSLLSFGEGTGKSGASASSTGETFGSSSYGAPSGIASMGQTRFVSWTKLFDWIQQFIEAYRSPVQQSAVSRTPASTAAMTPNEAVILRGFFRLLRNVSFYSVAAREALYQHTSYELVPRLFALYACPIIIEVKASLLNALAAFAQPTGSNAAKITAQLWAVLEDTVGVAHAGGMRAGTFSTAAGKLTLSGATYDLQMVEVPARIFPVTTSLVNFLKSLIHTPKRIDQQPIDALTGVTQDVPFQGLALNLGQGRRSPGLEPYVDFVIDSVLLQASSRDYSEAGERWRVTSACLEFVERCLMSYDLNVLLANGGEGADGATLASLTLHPGFNIMKRILTGAPLLQELLNVINPNAGAIGAPVGFEIINSNHVSTLFFASSVRHCMRVIQRVLLIQDVFLQVLLPTLSDAGSQLPAVDVSARVGHPSLYSPLDAHLLHAHQSVVQMALYINCTRNDIALLAIRIVGLLAASTAFSGVDRFGGMGYNRKMNRFVGLLEMSDEADRIRAGCVDRLEAEADEPAADLDVHVRATLALMRIAGTDDGVEEEDELQRIIAPTTDADEAIRLAILDLLIANTSMHQSTTPNVAHLLLGFDLRAVRPEEQVIPDADAFDSPPSALHAILALLRPDPSGATMPLSQRSPAFAERCHQLLDNLCRHPYTSGATLRYLRTKEDFFVRQLRTISCTPVKRTSSEHGALGVLIQPDGGHLSTTVDALISSLQIRGHLLAGVALELHTLCSAGMWAPVNQLVGVLLGRDSVVDADEDDADEDGGHDSVGVQHFEQRSMRLLEVLSSFDFEWHDAREESGQEPTILRNLDLSQARSSSAAREFDVRATLRLLAAARRELDRRGDLNESRRRAEFDRDATLILEHVASRNARRVIAIARRTAMQAWRNTLDMTFVRANHLLSLTGRASVILDCLSALLPRLSGATSESDPALSDLAAGAVLCLLTRLRHHQTSQAEEEAGMLDLPVDRLVGTLEALTAAIMQPGTTMQARGNLYSALINYLQLIKATPVDDATDDATPDDDGASSIGGASDVDDGASFAGFSSLAGTDAPRRKRSSPVEVRSRSLLAAQAERLVPVIARDALDATDLWRTVAFTLFDRLAALQSGSSSSSTSSRTLLLDILTKKGFLKSFVANIREMDIALQDVLSPDPSSLNALYVYEAQMAFFNRLAQTQRGAERLVDARLFDVLTQIDVLQARPQQNYPYTQDGDFVDLSSFLPAITSRYESLLLPAIQLAVSVLFNSARMGTVKGNVRSTWTSSAYGGGASSSASHAVARQALSFLHAHRSTLLISLKNATHDVVSIATLEQAQLVVSILTAVLPVLDDDALSPPKPLSHFHHAALALSATYLFESHWKMRVVPHTEAEMAEMGEQANGKELLQAALRDDENGGTGATLFDERARTTVQRLLAALLAYLERASEYVGVDDFGQRRVRPCLTSSLYNNPARGASVADEIADLSASTTGPGRYGMHAGRNAHVASLGTALASLDESVHRCGETMATLDRMQSMLDNADSVRLEEWDDVISSMGAEGTADNAALSLSDLLPARRKTVAVRLLRSQRAAKRAEVRFALNCIEMLLVLLFRHFSYYIELGLMSASDRAATTTSGAGAQGGPGALFGNNSLRRSMTPGGLAASTTAANETAALIRDGAKITSKVLEKLDGVAGSIDAAHGVANAEERKAYIAMTARRLQSTLLDRAAAADGLDGGA